MSRGPQIPTTILTDRDAAQYIYDKTNAKLGCIIRTANGYVAWSLKQRLGAFATAAEAERAVNKDKFKPASKPKSKPWENRS